MPMTIAMRNLISKRLRSSKCITSICLFLTCGVIFTSYWVTLARSVVSAGSATLVTEGCCMGTACPSIPPLLAIIYHIAINYLPLDESPAWKANVASAVFSTATAGCLFLCVVQFGRARYRYYQSLCTSSSKYRDTETSITTLIAAGTAAGLFAWSPLAWKYAVQATPCALSTATLGIILYAVIQFGSCWQLEDRFFWACCVALLCGVALSSQRASFPFLVPIISYVAWCMRKDITNQNQRVLLQCTGAFLIGLLPYFYLPVVAWNNCAVNYYNKLSLRELRLYSQQSTYDESPGSTPEPDCFGTYLWDFICAQGLAGLVPLLAVVGLSAATMRTGRFLLPLRRDGERYKVAEATDKYIQQIIADVPCVKPTPIFSREMTKKGPNQKKENLARTESNLLTWALAGAWVCSLAAWNGFGTIFSTKAETFAGMGAGKWMAPNLVVFIWAGVGMDWLASMMMVRQTTGQRHTLLPSATQLSISVCIVYVLLATFQFKRSYIVSDHHTNLFIDRYARCLLAPLPADALLFVEHNQLWTSMQYAQLCEGYRRDVTLLNLSRMKEAHWEIEQRSFGKKVVFPGTHCVTETDTLARATGAFTMSSLLDVNIDRVGGIFVAGNVTFPHAEKKLRKYFTELPMGLTMQIFRHEDVWNLKKWTEDHCGIWRVVQHGDSFAFPISDLPPLKRYGKGSAEYIVRRDYLDHLAEAAAHMLEEAIALRDRYYKIAGNNATESKAGLTVTKMSSSLILKYFLDAAWWLEVLITYDPEHPSYVLKNLGLAYIHALHLSPAISSAAAEAQLVRIPPGSPFSNLALNSTSSRWYRGADRNETDWRIWAMNRFDEAWRVCFQKPEDLADSEINVMRHQHAMIMTNIDPLMIE